MNVLMLNYEYPPLGGGGGTATRELLAQLKNRPDLSIDLVASSMNRAHIEPLGANIKLHLIDIGKSDQIHHQSLTELMRYTWRATQYCRGLMRTTHYDLCHAFFGLPCGFIARRLGLPYIISLEGSDVPGFNPKYRLLDALFFARLSRGVWHDCASVVANSEGLRAQALETAPAQPIRIIPHGIDLSRFTPKPQRDWTELRLLCVARMNPRKNLDQLIRAMDLLRDSPVHLTLIGKGVLENELRLLTRTLNLEDRVSFAGLVLPEAIAEHYQRHDLYVLPSSHEGMSLTMLEALASGLPMLAQRIGGTHELIQPGINGAILPDARPESIAAAVREYVREPSRLAAHSAASRNLAESMSWARIADQYARLYADVVAMEGSRQSKAGYHRA